MANQAIALQARAPQTDFMGRAIQQNAQMMNMLAQQRAAERQAAKTSQEMQFAAAEEARKAELQGPTMEKARSEATAQGIKTALDFSNFVYTGLSNSADPAQAMQIAQRIAQQPQFQEDLFQGALADAMSTMPQDPAQFEMWKENTLSKTLDGAKRLERQLIEQNLGATTRVISAPKYGSGGAARVLEGSEAPVTVKPIGMNVEGVGPGVLDPESDTFYPATMGTPGGYTPPRGPVSVPRGAPSAPAGGDTFSRMIGVESGGQQFDRSGKPLTSRAGAIGIAQVMPGTAPEAARLAGLPFDENRYRNDAEYNLALGKAYYEKQLADFGDERLAAAAYNAGPGAVRRALQKGGRDGWVSHVPRETQKYLQDVFGGAPAGRGSAGAPAPRGAAGEPPRTIEEEKKLRAFRKLLPTLGYDPDTGEDIVSPLIEASTSGGLEMLGSDIVGFATGKATAGREALGKLKAIAANLTFDKLDGKLGAQISNADVQLVANTMADIANGSIPANERLGMWRDTVLPILLRGAGIEPKKPAAAGKKPPLEQFRRRR